MYLEKYYFQNQKEKINNNLEILSLLKNVQEELKIYVLTMEFNNRQKEYKGVPNLIINTLDEKVKEKNPKSFAKKKCPPS